MHLRLDRFQYQSRSSQNLQRAAPAQYHGPALYKSETHAQLASFHIPYTIEAASVIL